jgi:hypothetical protein
MRAVGCRSSAEAQEVRGRKKYSFNAIAAVYGGQSLGYLLRSPVTHDAARSAALTEDRVTARPWSHTAGCSAVMLW